MDKKKYNQYEKMRLYIATCFWIFSLLTFANENKSSVSKNKLEDEAVKVDIIINKNNINDFEDENSDIEENNEDGNLIYLDQIEDEEEVKQKKMEKVNKFERIIRKIDEKVNPIIKFQISKSYGVWYLIKTYDNA